MTDLELTITSAFGLIAAFALFMLIPKKGKNNNEGICLAHNGKHNQRVDCIDWRQSR